VGNPYSFRRTICKTENSIAYGGSTGSSTGTSSSLTIDGQMQVYFFGIVLFIAMLFFFKDIFKVDRYD
jgi:hypothetical protein